MLEKARELGLALAASPEFERVVEARRMVNDDDLLSSLMNEFKAKREEVMNMMQSGNFDNEVIISASADMERLQQQLMENPIFSELIASEQEFQKLVMAVNHEINKCIGVEDSLSAEGSCSGNCSGCSGCAN